MDRLSELLNKSKAAGLSPVEEQELTSLLNAPILAPEVNDSSGFLSKYNFDATDLSSRLAAIEWFSHCGQSATLDLSVPFRQASGRSEAEEACKSNEWENATLEAQNQLTVWLHLHSKAAYQNWNELVRGFNSSIIEPLKAERWDPRLKKLGLDSRLISSIQWDILGALMENAYLEAGHRSFFFLELLTVYEAGHLPCGWLGEWPEGELLVY